MNSLIRYINSNVLRQARGLRYEVKERAPSTFGELIASPKLIVWNGESDNTVFEDCAVNYAFRAIHDNAHLKTRLNFEPTSEIELARIQASKQKCSLLAELFYCEIAEQAKYYLEHGVFVKDQKLFTLDYLTKKGYK